MVVATSMMTLVLYESDCLVLKANAAMPNQTVESDGLNDGAIPTEEFMIGVYYDSVIVSPDIYSEGVFNNASSNTYQEEPIEAMDLDTDLEPTEPNRDKIDISLLKTSEFLPQYKYGTRTTPSVEIPDTISETNMRNYIDEVDTSNYLYLGTYSITGYTPKCAHCCGNTKGITASGVEAVIGYTVAADKSIPFGTTLYIEGYGYYVVEDRGNFGTNVIDIAAPSHDVCYDLTNYGVHVYVVPSNNNT